MNLSDNLRRIRTERGMTQSALAEQLGVSDRAVSRWERGESLPDVTLLPRLAMLLHVSADALLGMDAMQRKAAVDKALEASGVHMQNGDAPAAIVLLRAALADYPDEPELMVYLARALMALHTQEGAQEALSLARAADGRPARLSTQYGCKQVMALALHRLGKCEQAAQLVSDEIPSFWVCRELLYPRVAPPDKADGQRQFNLLWLADHVYFTLRDMAKACADDALAAQMLRRAVNVYREITGESAGGYENRICQAYLLMAERLTDADERRAALENAQAAADRYAAHNGRYQAPWLSRAHDAPPADHDVEQLRQRIRSLQV